MKPLDKKKLLQYLVPIAIVIALIGLAAGIILSNRNQDIRSDAYCADCNNVPDFPVDPPPVDGPGDGTGGGQGDSCSSVSDCASPLNCGSPCPDGTVKAGQRVCYGNQGYVNACGGYSGVTDRVCNTLDRQACGSCDNNPQKQLVCNAVGQWECLTTDTCGATTRPPGSSCIYDSSCDGGYCDRSSSNRDDWRCVPYETGGGSQCTRDSQCESNNCQSGVCAGTKAPASCGSYGHGKFMGCGNNYGYPGDYDCFCDNGTTKCAYDADKQSCAAPGGVGGTTPSTPPSTSSPTGTPTSTNPPTNSPSSTPTSSATPTPTPTGTPITSLPPETNNPTFACESIEMSQDQPQIGDNVSFTCEANGVQSLVTSYRFRYRINGGDFQDIGISSSEISQSVDILIGSPGLYEVQCSACSNTSCTEWQTL